MPQAATIKSLPATSTACSCSMAWCSNARPAPARWRGPCWSRSACAPDGKKEVIDFRLAGAESVAQWALFLGDLVRRGLVGERLEMLCVDGGAGLLAALPTAFPDIPVQRCWAHKIRNVLSKVRKPDQAAVDSRFKRDTELTGKCLQGVWKARHLRGVVLKVQSRASRSRSR